MVGPAVSAMIGNVNITFVDGAMCVTPWNTTCARPSALRRSWGVVAGLAA